jgi:hypothetical protein
MRRLVMSYPADRPVSRLARFAGQAIAATVASWPDWPQPGMRPSTRSP